MNTTPLQKRWFDWNEISESTKQRYTNRCAEIVAAVLKTVSPDNAGDLWQALTSSNATSKLLGIDELSKADQRYLEVLAEAYKNAVSWDSRRQVMSIMAG